MKWGKHLMRNRSRTITFHFYEKAGRRVYPPRRARGYSLQHHSGRQDCVQRKRHYLTSTIQRQVGNTLAFVTALPFARELTGVLDIWHFTHMNLHSPVVVVSTDVDSKETQTASGDTEMRWASEHIKKSSEGNRSLLAMLAKTSKFIRIMIGWYWTHFISIRDRFVTLK